MSRDWKWALVFSGGEHPLVDGGSSWMVQLRMTPREGQLCLLIRHTGWQGIVREVPLLYWNLKLQIREMAGHVFHDGQTSHCPTWNTDFSLEFILKIYQYEKLAEVIELWWALRGKKVSSHDFLRASHTDPEVSSQNLFTLPDRDCKNSVFHPHSLWQYTLNIL